MMGVYEGAFWAPLSISLALAGSMSLYHVATRWAAVFRRNDRTEAYHGDSEKLAQSLLLTILVTKSSLAVDLTQRREGEKLAGQLDRAILEMWSLFEPRFVF